VRQPFAQGAGNPTRSEMPGFMQAVAQSSIKGLQSPIQSLYEKRIAIHNPIQPEKRVANPILHFRRFK
jgi:hypothetical protein